MAADLGRPQPSRPRPTTLRGRHGSGGTLHVEWVALPYAPTATPGIAVRKVLAGVGAASGRLNSPMEGGMEASDRRQHVRARLSQTVRGSMTRQDDIRVVNLSPSGALVLHPERLIPGETRRLALHLGGRDLHVGARVVEPWIGGLGTLPVLAVCAVRMGQQMDRGRLR